METAHGQTTSEERKTTEDKEKIFRCFGFQTSNDNALVIITMIGVVMGVALGFGLRQANLSADVKTVVAFPGELLLRILKMLVIPLITTSIVTGVVKLSSAKEGRVGLHIVFYYVVTTFCSVLIGIGMVLAIKPGHQHQVTRSDELNNENPTFSTLDTFLDVIRNLFPKNLVEAWFRVEHTKITEVSETSENNSSANLTVTRVKSIEKVDGSNSLGLIMFCLMIGATLGKMENKRDSLLTRFFDELYSVFMDIMMKVMWYSPIGICSLIAGSLLRVESILYTFKTLGLYMVTMFTGLFLHSMIVLPMIFFIITRRNPFKVYSASFHALLAIFGTNSSVATLPVTIRCAEENLGICKRFTRVMLPLGATINMDGTAMFQGVATITIAQMNGISLSFGEVITVWLTGTLAGIGAASVPGSGLVVVLFVLQSVGIPSEALGILYTVDWLVERMRGPVNIMGDQIGVCIVSHINRQRDEIGDHTTEAVPLGNNIV